MASLLLAVCATLVVVSCGVTTPVSKISKEQDSRSQESPVISKIPSSMNKTNRFVKLDKCCPPGETLGTSETGPCVPSEHRLLHPFSPPPIYKRPGTLAKNVTYTLDYGVLPKCDLLYFLEPDREPADVFWLLETGTVLRAGEGPLKRGNYCLEAIPSKEAVLPVLCFPDGKEEGVGVYAVYPVGMLVSIPFLASTFLVYAIFKELYNLHGRCLMCHVACLLLAYLCLAAIQVDTTAFPYFMCCVMGVGTAVVGEAGPLCRKCGREPETPAHVLGICPNNMLLVTRRHHNVKTIIQDLLRGKGFTCFDEVYCVDTDGSTRYVDILAFDNTSKLALILDPTIRFESNDPEQDSKVDAAKRRIYDKFIPFLREKFYSEFGGRTYKVRGLWFGARGVIPAKTADFFIELGIEDELPLIAEQILLDSLGVLHNHIYS